MIEVANFAGRNANSGRWMKNAIAKQAAAPSKHTTKPASLWVYKYKADLGGMASARVYVGLPAFQMTHRSQRPKANIASSSLLCSLFLKGMYPDVVVAIESYVRAKNPPLCAFELEFEAATESLLLPRAHRNCDNPLLNACSFEAMIA